MAISKLFNKSFFTRTLSGIVLIVLLLVTFIMGGYVIFGLTLLLSLIGVNEVYKTVGVDKSPIGIIGYLSVIAYYALVLWKGTAYLGMFIVALLIVMMAIYVFTFPKYKTEQVLMSFFGVVYVAVLMSFLYLIRMTNDGIYSIWLIIISSWGCDTCAYLAGVICGKHKMAPILSPKKTIEGAIGGVLGAAGIGAIYGAVVGSNMAVGSMAPVYFAVLCACAGLISMVGDLAASAIKRNYEIKDYGKLIPGHGGVLDRFDSVIFTAPIIYYLIYFLF
ncbi:MAG: phosphatidate cytidylyltransferase [Lachnospiraceae bacterium]|nr:phosphatidate cytidylyltransferase [Lachnospiraceae bacterium]